MKVIKLGSVCAKKDSTKFESIQGSQLSTNLLINVRQLLKHIVSNFLFCFIYKLIEKKDNEEYELYLPGKEIIAIITNYQDFLSQFRINNFLT